MLFRSVPLVGAILFLLIVSPSFAQSSRPLTPGLKRDRSALLALVNSMDKLGRSRMGAWKSKGNPCSPKPWPHISCKNGRVSAIDLANLELIGTLPGQLKRLNKLESLNMENNQLAGTIPAAWSDRQQFQALRSINLGNNLLSGSLPNRAWNRKNAFRSLEELNLAENRLTGGLPDGWLGTQSPFRKLKFLDLSDNLLGKQADGTTDMTAYTGTAGTTTWCLLVSPGLATDGWCPTGTPTIRLPVLEILDLSSNGLKGQLPTMWSRMFPNLQSLIIHHNGLYGTADQPADLPLDWTRRTVPRAFPQLETLVLYPGNDNICSIPDGEGNFKEINGQLSYVVESEDEMEFDENNPWFCKGPSDNNPATKEASTRVLEGGAGSTLVITFVEPTNAANQVYGYRVTLYKEDPDTEEDEPVPGWIGRMFQVYGVTVPSTGSVPFKREAGNKMTITIENLANANPVEKAGPAVFTVDGEIYKVEVTTYNLNTEESTILEDATATLNVAV